MSECTCNKFEMIDEGDTFYMLQEGSTPVIVDPMPISGSSNLVSSGGIYTAIEDATETDPTLSISGMAADAKVTGEYVRNLDASLSADESVVVASSGNLIYKFAQRVKSSTTGFVNTSGVVQSNSSYKVTEYDVPTGAKTVEIPSIYIAGGTSNYSVVAAYNGSSFIGAFNNHDSATTATNTSVVWNVPPQATSIKISWGNKSSSTVFGAVYFIGIFNKGKIPMIFNGRPTDDYQMQYYFHVPIASLDGVNSFALNGKFVFPCNVLTYDYYFTTYDSGYTNRTFLRYATGATNGIDGHNVILCLNQYDSSKSIGANAEYAGVIINFHLEVPPTTTTGSITSSGKVAFQDGGVYPCESEYCLINDVAVTTNYYPSGAQNSYVSKAETTGHNPMLGGRLCCIGDSLTAVYYKQASESWPYLIAQWNSMAFDNLGQSSCPLAYDQEWHDTGHQCMAEKCDGLSASKYYTHIFIMGGANDYNSSIPIGTNTDTEITTFKGAVNHIISTLTTKFPCAKIVFATTYQRTASRADKPYADAMIEVCKLNGIPCLNNYENSGVQMNSSAWMAKFGANGTTSNKHLNAAGDLFVAPRFEHALKYGIF